MWKQRYVHTIIINKWRIKRLVSGASLTSQVSPWKMCRTRVLAQTQRYSLRLLKENKKQRQKKCKDQAKYIPSVWQDFPQTRDQNFVAIFFFYFRKQF